MKHFSWLCGLTSSLIVGAGWLSGSDRAIADVVPDNTLSQPSKITPAGRRAVITEGTRRGSNLFHSFREFSIAPGETAAFTVADPGVSNIFARVTGNRASRISGAIEVLNAASQVSTANLFLLNPNGILFGKDAALRIGGSFLASTAEQINFADGTEFSAIRPQAVPLLTVSLPVGLQFGRSPGPIVNRSITPRLDQAGNQALDANGDRIFGLVGGVGQTLALVGGDVTLTGGSNLRTEGGRIELGSVAGAGEVDLRPLARGWEISYAQIKNFGDLRLLGLSQIDSSGTPSGAVQIQGRRVILQGAFYIFSDSYSGSTRPGGDLQITATDLVRVAENSLLGTSTKSAEQAGDVLINTPQMTVQSGGQVGSNTTAQGSGGDIRINAKSVTVAGFSLAGLSPEDFLVDYGRSPLSLIFSQADGTGRAGNIRITADQLTVQDGGQISTTTFGAGNAGNLSIRANQINLTETAENSNGQPLRDGNRIPVSGGLFVGTDIGSSGRGGRLRIETEDLTVRDGAIVQATTYGSGAAGNVSIQARQSVEVSGSSAGGILPARIAATSGGIPGLTTPESRQATGRGGSLTLSTRSLTVSDRGVITVNSASSDSPGAGTIRITAERVQLDRQGQLNAQTESGNRAGIELNGVDLLRLRRNSRISTTAGLLSDGGDAGDIRINADVILSAPVENSDIDADAKAGRGGSITIQAQGILGIAERSQRTPQSDITATSESNVNGEINISTASFDPTRGLAALPGTVVDASRLIAQGCRANSQATGQPTGQPTGQSTGQSAGQSEFVITGRGGLPPNPVAPQSGSAVIPHWVTVAPTSQQSSQQANRQANPAVSSDAPSANPAIAEAQGWVMNTAGKVELVAQSSALTPDTAHWKLPDCSAPQPQTK